MDAFLASVVSILFHGLAYGMILYAISVGLSVTMGLMGFVNLAHGVFAMAGGYLMYSAMTKFGLAWFPALVIACVIVALGSMVLERLLYSRLYTAGELEQVLFTIGLIFVAVAVARLDAAGVAPTDDQEIPPSVERRSHLLEGHARGSGRRRTPADPRHRHRRMAGVEGTRGRGHRRACHAVGGCLADVEVGA